MAASSAACTLSSLASKLGRLERQAELLDDLQAEEQVRVSTAARRLVVACC
jgi:hypothetical protein